MHRAFASTVLLILGVVHLAPLAVLLQFHFDRAQIERELCVQREVIAEMRTCHGECQLTKRFRILERSAEQDFPIERIQSRFEPKVPLAVDHDQTPAGYFDMHRPEVTMHPLERAIPTADPVPWA